MKVIFSILTCLCLSSAIVVQAETSSSNNSKVKEFYKNFPGSDADKNGVLTISEMRSFIMAKVRSSATSKDHPGLSRLLKKAPESDLNKDGVLTKTELIKYLN
ncbi:MAG: EF-hand domain-containing protein [Verrucomicrobiales bacterium]|nr:EF-hand domain-containing protein [Verrucomicrobiales bacterium]